MTKKETKCCRECFVPERDGETFHSHAAGYALPESCKDDDCPCHTDHVSEGWEARTYKQWRQTDLAKECKPWEGAVHKYFVDEIIRPLLKQRDEEIVEIVSGEKELHRHDSIPSYTADLDEGCIICIKNATVDTIINKIKGV